MRYKEILAIEMVIFLLSRKGQGACPPFHALHGLCAGDSPGQFVDGAVIFLWESFRHCSVMALQFADISGTGTTQEDFPTLHSRRVTLSFRLPPTKISHDLPHGWAVLDCGTAKSLAGAELAATLAQACEKRGRKAGDDRKAEAVDEKC